MADGTLPRTDLSASLIRDLRNLKHDEVDHLLSVVWGAFRDIAADKQGEIERVKRIYYAGGSTPGDATRGRAVFARAVNSAISSLERGACGPGYYRFGSRQSRLHPSKHHGSQRSHPQ